MILPVDFQRTSILLLPFLCANSFRIVNISTGWNVYRRRGGQTFGHMPIICAKIHNYSLQITRHILDRPGGSNMPNISDDKSTMAKKSLQIENKTGGRGAIALNNLRSKLHTHTHTSILASFIFAHLLVYQLEMLLRWRYIWPFTNSGDGIRICNAKRSKLFFNIIFFLSGKI